MPASFRQDKRHEFRPVLRLWRKGTDSHHQKEIQMIGRLLSCPMLPMNVLYSWILREDLLMVIPRLLYIITSVEDKTASASDLHVSLQHFLPVKVVKLRFPASEGKERFFSCSASLSFFCGYLFVMLFKEIPFFFIESFLRFLSNIDTFLGLASFSLRPVSLHLSVSLS